TWTAQLLGMAANFRAKILDTRKTAPGLRILDKLAVRAGGGFNHRSGLYDGVLLKDNHLRAAGGIKRAVACVRQNSSPTLKIEVEVGSLAEVREALLAQADIIMLDNMPTTDLEQAVKLIAGKA